MARLLIKHILTFVYFVCLFVYFSHNDALSTSDYRTSKYTLRNEQSVRKHLNWHTMSPNLWHRLGKSGRTEKKKSRQPSVRMDCLMAEI